MTKITRGVNRFGQLVYAINGAINLLKCTSVKLRNSHAIGYVIAYRLSIRLPATANIKETASSSSVRK